MNFSSFVRRLAVLLCAALLLTVCACTPQTSQTPPEPEHTDPAPSEPDAAAVEVIPLTLDGLIGELNAQRRVSGTDAAAVADTLLPDITSEDFLADEFTDSEFALITGGRVRPQSVTCEQAKEDVDYLFRILRTSYGAYEFFGGDERFGAAKQEIYAALDESYTSGIGYSDFLSLLLDKLSFIEDSHFAIDYYGVEFEEERYFRDSHGLVFRQDSLGYYACSENDASGERWYLAEEDQQYLKKTIAPDGELVYGLFALTGQDSSGDLPKSFRLRNADGKGTSYGVEWSLVSNNGYQWNDGCYSFERIDGIPVISLTTYYLEEESFDGINSYLNDSKQVRDDDVIIIDLSYNTGGYDILSSMWLYSLTDGVDIGLGVGYLSYISRLNEYVLENNEDEVDEIFHRLDFFDDYPEYWEEDSEEEDFDVGDIYAEDFGQDFFEQDRTVFVIFNKYTYSAGELALFQFSNMENVVFVGVNSNGCLLTGGTNMDAPVSLPNSGIAVSYSILLVTTDMMESFDSRGFQPDIIADNATAVQDVINCWNYYHKS